MIHRYLLSPLSLLLAVCCDGGETREPEGPSSPEVPEGPVQLTLSPAVYGNSLGDTVRLCWQSGDKVSVGGRSYAVAPDSDGRAVATVPGASSYTAFSPADIISGSTVYVQPAQYHVADGVKSLPSYATCDNPQGGVLQMQALQGLLRVEVRGSVQIAGVAVSDNAGGRLCGTYTLSGQTVSPVAGIAFPDVTLNCKTSTGTGAALSPSGTVFYIAVPASDYPLGFTARVSGRDGKAVTAEFGSPVTVAAGGIVRLPAIDYAPPSEQLYSLHFDNLVAGGEPAAGLPGFACASFSSPGGFENYGTRCESTKAGAAVVTARNANKAFDLPKSYQYSRNLQDFTELCYCQEYRGCIGCGATMQGRAILKLPRFSAIPDGKVCRAEISMKMAGLKGVNTQDIDILPTYSTVGKILELWIDGRKVADCTPVRTTVDGSMGDGTRWSTEDDATSVTASVFGVERVRVRASELSDGKWHDVKVVMGAVTSATVIQICPHSSSTTSGAFFLDDITVSVSDYDLPASFYEPSWIISLNSVAMSYLANQAKTLGYKKYIDIGIGTTFFTSRDWDEARIIADLSTYVSSIRNAGFKVWNIHLPATDAAGSYDTDIFEYFHPDAAVRREVVERTKTVLRCLKAFESVNLMVHATGKGRYAYDFDTYKDYGVDSFRQLVEYCGGAEMQYSDGTHPQFCIENIQNKGTKRVHVNALAEYMNYYCTQVPGLKVCLDTSHSQVCEDGGESTIEYCRKLGSNLCALHIHGNGLTNRDRHIFPGYRDGLYYDTGGNDLIDWPLFYRTLRTDCGYQGPFTYEIGSNAADCIASFSNIVHNYYTVVLEPYKVRYGD